MSKESELELLKWVYEVTKERLVRNKVGKFLGHDIEAEAAANSFEKQGIELPASFTLPASGGDAPLGRELGEGEEEVPSEAELGETAPEANEGKKPARSGKGAKVSSK